VWVQAPSETLSAEGFRFFEEVGMEAGAGVEDFDADEAVVRPAEDDECRDAFGRVAGMLVRPRVGRSPVR